MELSASRLMIVYISYIASSGNITQISYQKPNSGPYLEVDPKVGDKFLTGDFNPTDYKIEKPFFRSKPILRNVSEFDHFTPTARKKHKWNFKFYTKNLSKISYHSIQRLLNKAYWKFHRKIHQVNRLARYSVYVINNLLTNVIFPKIADIFSPYTPLIGEHYIYKFLGFYQFSKNYKDIDKTLKNVCVAPWIHLHTWPNNNVYPCCLTPSENPVGNLTNNSIEEVWNGPKMKKLRQDFLNGERPDSCKRCFAIEDAGGASLRSHLNHSFKADIDFIKYTYPDGSLPKMNIKYWDFRFSNICNFKCRSCGPQLSSGWYEDTIAVFGELPKDLPDPKNVQVKPTWKDLDPLFEVVEEIYFAGGEPLLMDYHYRILQRLIDENRYDVRLRYNTNLSKLLYKKLDVIDLWKHFTDIRIGASFDGIGAKAEYIRKGCRWDEIVSNINRIKTETPHIDLFVNFTLGVLNAYHMTDFYKYFVEHQFIEPHGFHINLIQHPACFSLQALPKNAKEELTKEYKQFADYMLKLKFNHTAENINMAINYMNETDRFEELKSAFASKIEKVDIVRGEKLLTVLPELGVMYK